MPTREQMIAELRAAQGQTQKPSREQMIAELKALKSPTVMGLKADPSMFEQHDLLGEGLELGARVLDFPGGLIRTGAAGLMGVAGKEDFKKALSGQAPTSAQYLERGGVSPGFEVPKDVPVVGGLTGRDVEGFALDVASDPLTLLSKGYRALRPAGGAVERA